MGDWADECERQADIDEEEMLDLLRSVNEKRDAVIKAAEDATVSGDLGRVLIRLGLVPGLEEPVKRIIRAVEALQEARDE